MDRFPFSAVLGQEPLKLALVLCAIDPAIGGVLVRGPRGVGKTTLARAFADLLPGRFVELPLGATEERVAGSLDLGKALGQGEVAFSPGLLARAHDGVLYVDEVNLLPDALVDLLLDAAATGRNVVERDGVSHVHPARFVLVGTMNPEEGELRPQLCDRFGLSVTAENALSPDERARVVLRRLEFERDPARFASAYEAEQRDLLQRCAAARRRVAQLPFTGAGATRAAELCHAARVEGVRADLAMLRAARAHAAWHDHGEILASDVDAVAELALAHRRRGAPPPTGERSPAGHGSSGSGHARGPGHSASSGSASSGGVNAGSGAADSGGSASSDGASSGDSASSDGAASPSRGRRWKRTTDSAEAGPLGTSDAPPPGHAVSSPAGSRSPGAVPDALNDRVRRGALQPVPVRSSAPPALPRWLLEPRLLAPRARARPRTVQQPSVRPLAAQRRRRGGRDWGEGAIDWSATLLQSRHLAAPTPGTPPEPSTPTAAPMAPDGVTAPPRVIRRSRRLARAGRWVLVLDCSASMLQSGALAAAKGLARALASRAANTAVELALISFGGDSVNAPPAFQRDGAALERAIASLGAAGGTPMRRALQIAFQTSTRRATLLVERRLFLFTDGRTRERVDDLAHPSDVHLIVIDCERGALRLGRARHLAATLQADYAHIDEIAGS